MMRQYVFTIFCLLFISLSQTGFGASPLNPIKLDNPRDTMTTYWRAMDDHIRGVETDDEELISRIDDAARCFNLSEIPFVVRKEKGRELAKILKEVIDRVIVVDLSKVPEDSETDRWRLKDTEITVIKVSEGEKKGEYLFSKDTVFRLKDWYKKVESLPYKAGTTQGARFKSPWHERYLPKWSQEDLLGIPKWKYVAILLSIFLGFLIKVIVQFIVSLFKNLTSKREGSLRHKIFVALENPSGLVAASFFWFLSIQFLSFEGVTLQILSALVQISFCVSIIWAAYRLTDVFSHYLEKLAVKTDTDLDDHLVPLLAKSIRIFVVILGGLMTVQNLGVNVMSLLAGLGLGGLAFALAAKDTAANFFGSIMILMDRPFKIGDWIHFDDVDGNIEDIGFRSTRIRTFYNSQITVPNSTLANKNIDNMGRRRYRRVYETLGVTYDTNPSKVENFIEGIKKIILSNDYTRKDYFNVYFNGYGDSSLNIMVYFFLEVPDWPTELQEKQNVLLNIYKLADELGVEFAFPTQTLHVESLPEKSAEH